MANRRVIYEATERQAAFHAAPEMFKLYGGAMGGGKSYALCAEALALSVDYPGNRGYLCRHELTSFKKSTGLTLEAMLDLSGMVAKRNQSDNYYLLTNGSMIFYGGLGDDVKAIDRLKSMELGWFAIDEASETTEKFFLMLTSRLRLKLPGIKYYGIMATNPAPGWVKQRFVDSKHHDHIFVPALPADNPHLPDGYVDRLSSIFPPEWQARFINGDWGAFEGTNNVFPYQAIVAAVGRELPAGEPVELGVDVARYGDDESVIVVRRGPVARVRRAFSKLDLMSLAGEIVVAQREEGATEVKIDADGIGAGVVDRLVEQRHEVTEIRGGLKASDPEKFKNRKAEIYWGFRERLEAGTVAMEDDLELRAQLTSCTYRVASSGQIEITPKEEMKRSGLKSPDRAEALIYAFAPPRSGSSYFGFSAGAVYEV